MQKLFNITARKAIQPVGILSGVNNESELRDIAADNLSTLFDGVRLFEKEYRINDLRIDTVGIGEDYRPVLIEYKKGRDNNVVSQILAYYHEFMENETDFRWQVSQNPELGGDIAKKLNFDSIRLICLAGDFNRYDLRSWKSHKSVELVTYRYFDNNTLLLEWKEGGGVAPDIRTRVVPDNPAKRFASYTFTSTTSSAHSSKSEKNHWVPTQNMRQAYSSFIQ